MSWNVTDSLTGIYDFEIGLSSTPSDYPDIMMFVSSSHHAQLTIHRPNLNTGRLFYFTVKSISRTGVENIQVIYAIYFHHKLWCMTHMKINDLCVHVCVHMNKMCGLLILYMHIS